jgi:hypothetical protein
MVKCSNFTGSVLDVGRSNIRKTSLSSETINLSHHAMNMRATSKSTETYPPARHRLVDDLVNLTLRSDPNRRPPTPRTFPPVQTAPTTHVAGRRSGEGLVISSGKAVANDLEVGETAATPSSSAPQSRPVSSFAPWKSLPVIATADSLPVCSTRSHVNLELRSATTASSRMQIKTERHVGDNKGYQVRSVTLYRQKKKGYKYIPGSL